MPLLSVISDVFEISGRGIVVIPGVPAENGRPVKTGDHIRLVRPDGTSVASHVAGIEMISRTTRPAFMPILLGGAISMTDVPVGTEIWIDDGE